MKVSLSRKAKKTLDELQPEIRARLEDKISELLDTAYPSGCRKLIGMKDGYRLRVGDYRILYVILSREESLIFKISTREGAYE